MAGAPPPRKDRDAPSAPHEAPQTSAADELRRQSDAEELRREAEERVDGLTAAAAAAAAASPVPEDMAGIVHELRVHQIELEMQNEELRRAQLALDAQREAYFNLFDLAPVGYLTLSDKGIVAEANVTAAHLLGVDLELLIGQPLSAFVLAPDRDAYYLHLRRLWATGEQQTWELRLRRAGGAAGTAATPGEFWARFEARPHHAADGETPSCWMTFTDVDESVAAREALRESREALREAHALAHIGVWEWEAASDSVIWTEELYRIAGLDPRLPAPTYAKHAGIYTPESWRRLQAAVERALKTGEPYRLELELVRPDGATRWVHAAGGAASDDGGGGVRLCGTVQDITETKLAEEALERSRLLLRSSLESQKDTVLFCIDHDYRYLYFNKAHSDVMKRAYGQDIEVGRSILDYIASAEDRIAAKENYDRALAGESHTNVRVFGDAELAYYESFFNPLLTESGEIIGATGLARDITERKLAEQELQQSQALLQAAMDRSQAGIAIADAPDGRLRYVNEAALLIRGSTEAEVVDQVDAARYVESWHILHHDGTPYAPDEVPLARAVLYGETSEAEFIIRRDDEEDRIVLARAAPIRDVAGTVTAGVVVFHDVTERKLAENEVRRLNAGLEQRVAARTADLEAVNKELEAFVYSAAHDLRAPLRAIDGFSQMVVEDAAARLDDDDREHLQRVRAAAERMGALIDHLIELSRTARVDLLSERVDLSAVATAVLADLRRAAPEREVEAVVQPDLMVMADATLLEVILVNLLSNAWKFTSKRATAHIEVGATDGDGDRAFFVRDDGVGFDPKQAEHLFGAFQRFHTPEDFPGDGIGLATVQRLVARHGGRVWAEAEVEKGATFFFTLPDASTVG